MFEIELDIFSGRPNPRWSLDAVETRELLTRVLDDAAPMAPVTSSEGLGYRGFICRATGATAATLSAHHLPTTFRIRDGLGETVDVQAESWLMYTAQAAEMQSAVADAAKASMAKAAPTDAEAAKKCKLKKTSTTDFSDWNSAEHQSRNNCYNFASNYITDTFAQPGRGAGEMYHGITADEIHKAALRDGYLDNCGDSSKKKNLHVGYCIWPGVDYHWYRQTKPMDGEVRWCHKPGGTAARNYDSSGDYITDPSTCNRGGYTIWGGFMWNPGKRNKSVR